jgi:hypothetical protein
LWSDTSDNNISPSVLYTEHAAPLPSPPQHLLENAIIKAALDAHRDFIKVECPYDVDCLEAMLHDHPNQPFVQSVLKGLREGFWPFHDGEWKNELDEFDGNFSSEEPDLEAIRAYRDKELTGERWSTPISKLMPGMKISPMFVVWQQSDEIIKPRIITDQTASGLNDGIPREDAKVRYDDMRSFGHAMREARRLHPNTPLVLFKDDITGAFPTLPAHPIWQLRQVVQVDSSCHIVRRLCFGGRSSPRIWCALSALICWIAVRKLSITGLHVYMDDFFGWDLASNLIFFRGRYRPRNQVQLLLLWDRLRVPYGDLKQDHGATLKIIGFWVDINLGTISLTPTAISDLADRITTFITQTDRKPPLRDWQQLTGHLNWAINVLPWGRPALTELYRKMNGKTHARAGIFLNVEVIESMKWFQHILSTAIGVRFIDNDCWEDHEADMVVWTDASLKLAIAFVYANKGFVYEIREADPKVKIDIFFLEMIGILSAVHHAASLPSPPKRLLIWSDSLNSVQIHNSLRATEALHNGVLLAIASIIIRTGIDLRVRHIPGKENIRADLLSRFLFKDFHRQFPSYRVHSFEPPRDLLPARWRQSF